MAKLINIEKSKFINDNIKIYGQNKIGQYSKFLNKNPIFVTYYHINQTMSRGDVGTGGIEAEIGKSSPVRFNKINTFPLYNIPEIKPDLIHDESGTDIELELSDIYILPGTIKPIPGSYILIQIPGAAELLMRVNNIRYNTIQSNDFYMIDIDCKDVGVDLIKKLEGQVVEEFETIFENIGTQDKCFVRSSDVDKINDLVSLLETMKESYMNLFYNKECNSFVLYDNPCNRCNKIDTWLYDLFLEKFIMDAKIYYVDNMEKSVALTPNDIPSIYFRNDFTRTMWNAIICRSMDFINVNTYFYQNEIAKPFSPFLINQYPTNSVMLYLSKERLLNVNDDDHFMNPDGTIHAGPLREYFSIDLINSIINKELLSEDYIDMIVYNYFNYIKTDIDKKKIIELLNDTTERGFYYMPIIMVILSKYYDEYFNVRIDL